MYNNFIFDLYGTLVDIHTDEDDERLWKYMAKFYSFRNACYNHHELKEKYIAKCKEKQQATAKQLKTQYPDITIEEVFSDLFNEKGIRVNKDSAIATGQMFRILSTEYIKLYDGVIDLLETLKNQNKKIFLLTNAQKIFTEPEIKLLKLQEYFNGIYFSSEYKRTKPDKLFMNELIKDNNLEVSQCIMIGNDEKADIGIAESIGMDSLYIHSNISPETDGNFTSTYKIMDGDFKKIKQMII